MLNGVLLAVELVVVSVVMVELESVVLVVSLLLLHDQTAKAERQMAKENNFFFIKWFLCVELQKICATPAARNGCWYRLQILEFYNQGHCKMTLVRGIQHNEKVITLFTT